MSYAELQVTTHYSFLRGAGAPRDYVTAAASLGIGALGVVDRNSVAGIVRMWDACRQADMRLVPGCRLDLTDGTAVLVWPEDRAGWSRLTRLLSLGKARRPEDGRDGKPPCRIDWDMLADHADGLIGALVPDGADAATAALVGRTRDIFGDRGHLTLTHRRRPGDIVRLDRLDRMARDGGLVPLATGDVLYPSPDQRRLAEVMAAIRETVTIDAIGFRRERFADRHMKSAAEMRRLFRRWPHAVAATGDVVARCTFSMDQLRYQYPEESTPGLDAQATLEARIRTGLAEKWPRGAPDAYLDKIAHELRLVRELRYAPYFLTVNAIVAFARSKGILCQGRGSAANSLICFVLGITSIDPIKHELLFERFVSGARDEPPDIDVDFEHERREEVIQWVYDTYGRERAALTAVVTCYRARGAVRDVGKALGLSEDITAGLAGQVWGWSVEGVGERHAANLNLDATDPRLALTLELARQLIGTPRHLSQHPGGFVLTNDRLDDLVPIAPAAMEDRQVIEWDKDDIEILRFMKVDVLGLGMLGCMRRAFDLLAAHKGRAMDLADAELQEDDPGVYAMISRADTLGTFQIESRAQMSMLPRMKPTKFYDIVIQVAIVRPGPIQGDMVHPYLRRREGKEQPEYPKPDLKAVLEKTFGVPLFQEQAMRVAIVGANFTPEEADGLRRSMATFKFTDGVGHWHDRLVGGMVANGYTEDFATRTFKQIEGFGSYGFPESHAASFAKIAYASCWMKHHHPDVFACALLNAQPMGFYAPAQIVRDALEHGVEMRPVSINDSEWDCHLGDDGAGTPVTLPLPCSSPVPAAERVADAAVTPPRPAPRGTGKVSAATGDRAAAMPEEVAPAGHSGRVPPRHMPAQIVRYAHRHGAMVDPESSDDSGCGRHSDEDGAGMVASGAATAIAAAMPVPCPPAMQAPAADASVAPVIARRGSASVPTGDHAAVPAGRDIRLPLRLGLRMVRGLSVTEAERIADGRPYASVEDAWRRSGVTPAALERIAEADGFRCLGLDRRQALWQVRGLGAKPLPLFAALDAAERRGGGPVAPEATEPLVTLSPMSAGREVVEDYRATQLSLRAHPLHFLRPELDRRGILPASALGTIRNGRAVEVAGIILVRQKPGSAKGVLFLTVEDETGIANGILWPDRFEAQRVTVLSAAMIGIRGHVQREGVGEHAVIHVIAHRIIDYTPLLRTVGGRDFPHRPGPGDGATHPGSPDRGDPGYKDGPGGAGGARNWPRPSKDSYHRPFRTGADPEDVVLRQKSRDFH